MQISHRLVPIQWCRCVTYKLIRQHKYSLQGKLATAEVEKILKTRPQEIHHQHIVVPLYPIPSDVGDSSCGKSGLKAWSEQYKSTMEPRSAASINAHEEHFQPSYFHPEKSCTALTRTTTEDASSSQAPASPVEKINKLSADRQTWPPQ